MNSFTKARQGWIWPRKTDLEATLHLSYPIVIAQIGIVLMGVTDNLMVGGVGAEALAAAGVANSLFFLIAVIGIGVLSIVSPLVAAAKSREDTTQCARLLVQALWISVGIALLSIIALFALSWQFHWFRQKPEVSELAIPYLQIIAISLLPMLIFLALKSFVDGLSYTQAAMHVTFICFFLNILFNWVLIYGHWGLPALGLDGAGIATLLSRCIMALGLLFYILNSGKIRPFCPQWKRIYFHGETGTKILKLGLPAGLQYLFEVGAFAGASIMIGWLGTDQLAAHQIAISLASITYMVAAGFASAGAILVGDALGKQSRASVMRSGGSAFLLTVVFMSLSCLLFISLNNFLVGLYINSVAEPEVTHYAVYLLIIAGFFQLSDGIQCTALGALRGLEDVYVPTWVAFVAYWVIGLPVGYVLAFYLGQDIYGTWYGLSLGLTVSAILLTIRFVYLARDYQEPISPGQEAPTPTKVSC